MSGAAAPVGYYVHHHGGGHAATAAAAAAAIGDRLVGLGSGPPPPGWAGDWIALPRDDEPRPGGDPTHDGAWQWVPEGHAGFARRMRTVASWVASARPGALVVDVSAEVVALGALLGVPTAAVLLHGRRDDRPHRLAWDSATALVAPWPAAHGEPWQRPWADRTAHLGLLSRFDGRATRPRRAGRGPRRVTVLLPSGAHALDPVAVEAAARATAAGWRWRVVGAPPEVRPGTTTAEWVGHLDDPWPRLVDADVVVAACGAGSVADIAAARRPAVLLPQARPFAEQEALAGHLDGTAPVAVRTRWPDPEDWPALLDEVDALDPDRWAPHHDGRAAARLAAVVAHLEADRT